MHRVGDDSGAWASIGVPSKSSITSAASVTLRSIDLLIFRSSDLRSAGWPKCLLTSNSASICSMKRMSFSFLRTTCFNA